MCKSSGAWFGVPDDPASFSRRKCHLGVGRTPPLAGRDSRCRRHLHQRGSKFVPVGTLLPKVATFLVSSSPPCARFRTREHGASGGEHACAVSDSRSWWRSLHSRRPVLPGPTVCAIDVHPGRGANRVTESRIMKTLSGQHPRRRSQPPRSSWLRKSSGSTSIPPAATPRREGVRQWRESDSLGAVERRLDRSTWDASPDGPKVAAVWGAPNDDRPSGSFVKLPARFAGTLRSHGSTFRAVVIQGRPEHQVPGETQVKAVEAGGYFSSKGPAVHEISSDAGQQSILYVRSEGKFEVTRRQPKKQSRSSRLRHLDQRGSKPHRRCPRRHRANGWEIELQRRSTRGAPGGRCHR